jgi:hypothetical protein
MAYFFLFLYILFGATAIYYIVFFSFLYYWHEKKSTFVVVPLIYTFNFFLIGFLIICIVSIAIEYMPDVFSLTKFN